MKKSPSKLVLRKETLRALSGKDLARVMGGDADQLEPTTQSGDKQCPVALLPNG